jgi:hypothetical protein
MSLFRSLSKLLFLILLTQLSFQPANAQTLVKIRSTLCAGGSSKKFISNGKEYFIQQSIGQTSLIGLSQADTVLLRQGFIQPVNSLSNTLDIKKLQVSVFPNPFSSTVTLLFTEEISDQLYITFYDSFGKTVYCKENGATQQLCLDVGSLSSGLYIIRVNSGKKYFLSKLIKE